MEEKLNLPTELTHSGFFVLRTPLLPFDDFLNWGGGLSAPDALNDIQQLELKLAADRQLLRDRLSQIIARPEVLEALYVASPDLEESLDVWRRSPESSRGQRVERALVRYFSRMSSRPTPFGLFAGISLGRIAEQTDFVLADRAHYLRHTRLDMNYLWSVVDSVALKPHFKRGNVYRVNSSLYRVFDRFHYVEERIDNNLRSHHLTAIESSSLLNSSIEQSRDGISFMDLSKRLAGLEGMTLAQAAEFVEELIDNQVLIPDFGPPVTAPDPLLEFITQLKKFSEADDLTSQLEGVAEELGSIDSAKVGVNPERYRALVKKLDQLTTRPTFGRYFQVDLIKPAPQLTLGPELLGHIRRSLEVVHSLAPTYSSALDHFRSRFIERFDKREVPLVEVLDEEIGIGFGNLNALEREVEGVKKPDPNEGRDRVLLKKILYAQTNGQTEISLDAEDLRSLATPTPAPLPPAFAVTAVIIWQEDGKDYQIEIKNVIGPSGANMFGRFCGAESALNVMVNEHLRAEERLYPDAVFAEVVYLPEERVGNVLCRPQFREFEIPYLGRSGAPIDHQILLTDLLVSISGDRIVLRSKRLGVEVIPRLTSAHNFASPQNLTVYRFLGALQRQKTTQWFGWDWGILKDLEYLPRVSSGRLILSRARWRVSSEELFPPDGPEPAAAFTTVQEWRAKRKLPRYAALVDDDRILPFDFLNVLSVEMFLDLIKKRRVATLIEMFVSEASELFARSPEGNFSGEIIAPFIDNLERARWPINVPLVASRDRSFVPGSEWLYLKFYAGPSTIDRILCRLRPLMESTVISEAIDRWFFIRYSDPHWHLRLRFHGDPATLRAIVLPQVQDIAERLVHAGLVWRVQIDTYEREIERYGGLEGTALAEEIFCADSLAALKILSTYSGNAGATIRWLLTLRSIDQMLSDFGLETPGKYEFVRRKLRDPTWMEIISTEFKRNLGEKHRNERKAIENMMDLPLENNGEYGAGLSAIYHRSEVLIHLAERFRALESGGKLTVPVSEILSSLTHLHINRVLKSDLKVQEFVTYDFLRRYYESWAGKRKETLRIASTQ
jgi:class I lanthipeptide synthase